MSNLNKYYEEFVNQFENEKLRFYYNKIITYIQNEAASEDITQWSSNDVDKFLFDLHSVSQNAIHKNLHSIRAINKFVCNKKGIQCTVLKPSLKIKEYIDYSKLRSQIITHDDYLFIRNELDFYMDNQRWNVRDKVMFELAWEGLSANEMQDLKEEDLEFIDDKLKIKLKKRVIQVTDPVVIKDIKCLLKEREYVLINYDGRIKIYDYRDSKYLIKPILIRPDILSDRLFNITTVYKYVMDRLSINIGRKSKNWDGTEHDLDIRALSIQAVRRSKIIYLLQFKYINPQAIQEIFGKSQSSDIVWLTQISKKVYGES